MRLNLKRLALLCGKAARACARVVGLTPARVDLLAILLHGEYAQVDLATRLCVTEAVISRMVRPLVALGLIRRRVPPEDRRLRLVSLTASGRAALQVCLDDHVTSRIDSTRGAQCLGEAQWLSDWRKPLARGGFQVDSVLELEALRFGVFSTMRQWNRAHTYDLAFDASLDGLHPPPLP